MNNRFFLMLTAAALFVAIAWSAWQLNTCMVAGSALDKAEQQVAAGSYDAALTTLASTSFLDQTQSIKERGQAIVRGLVAEASSKWHPVRSVGGLSFDPERSAPLPFGSDEVLVRISLHPKSLDRFVKGFSLGTSTGTFEEAQASLPINLSGEGAQVECSLSLQLDSSIGGVVEVPGIVRVVKELGRPQIALGILHQQARHPLLDLSGEASATLLPRESISAVVKDPHGLREVQWSFGDKHEIKRFTNSTFSFTLPIGSTEQLRGRSPTLHILAINQIGNESKRMLKLDFKSLDWNPVARARIGNIILRDDQSTKVRGGPQELRLDLLQGIRIDHLSLSARTENKVAQALDADGEALVTQVVLGDDSAQGISLLRGTRVLKTWALTVDSGKPTVTLRTKEGRVLEPGGDYVFDAGQELEILASDDTGIAPGGLRVKAEMLQLGRPRRVSNQVEAVSFTIAPHANGRLEVTAVDSVGNACPALTWSLRARHPLQVSKAALESFQPGEERQALSYDRPTLRFDCSGEGKVFVRVLGESPASAASRPSFESPFRQRVESVIDLKVPKGSAIERQVWLESDDGRRLASWKLLVDRRAPEIRISGDSQELLDESRLAIHAGPELEGLKLEIWENSGDPTLAVSGAIIRDREQKGNTTQLELSIPDELPAEIAVVVSDHAGNRKRVILAVSRSETTLPIVRLLMNGQELPSGADILVKHLDALRVSVIHGTLRRVRWGRHAIGVSADGRLGIPNPLPTPGTSIPLSIHVAGSGDSERSYQYKVGLVPFKIPKALAEERKHLKARLSGASSEIRARVVDDLSRRIEAAARAFLDQREKNAFLSDLERIREEQ